MAANVVFEDAVPALRGITWSRRKPSLRAATMVRTARTLRIRRSRRTT